MARSIMHTLSTIILVAGFVSAVVWLAKIMGEKP